MTTEVTQGREVTFVHEEEHPGEVGRGAGATECGVNREPEIKRQTTPSPEERVSQMD